MYCEWHFTGLPGYSVAFFIQVCDRIALRYKYISKFMYDKCLSERLSNDWKIKYSER